MRIRAIKIAFWRHFENIELMLDDSAGLVCVVGANGTGKTHLLEIISACAHHLGLSQGIEIPRGDPFSDPHEFYLQFYIAEGVSDGIDQGLSNEVAFPGWDRTLLVKSQKDNRTHRIAVEAGGIVDDEEKIEFAQKVVNIFRKSNDVFFLSLDADRAYPKKV